MSSITAVSEKIKTFIKKELADSSLNHFSLSLSSQKKKKIRVSLLPRYFPILLPRSIIPGKLSKKYLLNHCG